MLRAMTNTERGEVTLRVPQKEGEPKEYTLKLSMNAACILESRLNKKIGDILTDTAALSFKAIRDMVWMLLQKHHKKEFEGEAGLLKAGDLIEDAGGAAMFFDVLKQLSIMNQPPEDRRGGDGTGPLGAQDGRGDGSTSKPSPFM